LGETTLAQLSRDLGRSSLRAAFGNSVAYVLINTPSPSPVARQPPSAFARLVVSWGDKHLFLQLHSSPPHHARRWVLTLPDFQLFSPCLVRSMSVTASRWRIVCSELALSIWISLQRALSPPVAAREWNETAFLDGYSRRRLHLEILLPHESRRHRGHGVRLL